MKIKLFVVPNSSHNIIVGWHTDALKIKVAAPPAKGKANKVLIEFLSNEWNIPKKAITIIKGFKSRNKVIHLSGVRSVALPENPQTKLL